MTPGEIVGQKVAAANALDLEALLATLTDDVIYENVPIRVCKGIDEVREWLGQFYTDVFVRAEVEILHKVEQGNIVMVEKTNRFYFPDGREFFLRLMGMYEIRDGKIAVWRDYFDGATSANQMGELSKLPTWSPPS